LRIEFQRLVFDFVRKKAPAVAGVFFLLLRAFLKGVLEKRVIFGRFIVVRAWWIRGELWFFEAP
jgi:hypothetical protein